MILFSIIFRILPYEPLVSSLAGLSCSRFSFQTMSIKCHFPPLFTQKTQVSDRKERIPNKVVTSLKLSETDLSKVEKFNSSHE